MLKTRAGRSYPLGACLERHGINFSLYSKSAQSVTLLLFDEVNSRSPCERIVLDRQTNRTDNYWHIFVEGLTAGTLYGFQVEGPFDLAKGMRFDASKVLCDPYAKEIRFPNNYSRKLYSEYGQSTEHCALKSVVLERRNFDWKGTKPIHRPLADTIIYEMHVGGFTRHPSSGVTESKRGTYAGVVEKIPYLKQLGVTAVELMPVAQFDSSDAAQGKTNYWGYCPVGFFAPHTQYSANQNLGGPFDEFRLMVRELHAAGIEVIVDVVFNHTSEGNENGPTLSLRGLQNDTYYILEQSDQRYYSNYSGCGNTCNTNNSVMRRMIRDVLTFWVTQMHVDGFRFDLASVLMRDSQGQVLNDPPLLWSIDSDPILAGTKIIAEAWDAGGLYQVGQFVGDRWNEWNGLFRDDVRAFLRGDNHRVGAFANRLMGSPDLYYDDHRTPHRSINFVTAHDGFTLRDLVSYNHKHNAANGEDNRDGDNHNLSFNFGVEGPTNNRQIRQIRERQIKNFFTIMLMSLGTPMINMGDEIGRTQWGNNNAYCQDTPNNWLDWSLVKQNAGLLRFVRQLIEFRFLTPALDQYIHHPLSSILNDSQIKWHGVKANQPDWSDDSHTIALSYNLPYREENLYLAVNAYWEPLDFELPQLSTGKHWRQVINTALAPPDDIYSYQSAKCVESNVMHLAPRSVLVLIASQSLETPSKAKNARNRAKKDQAAR
ncbi:glycogen debranching protein GlgX [Celerinatantimonas sp. MCCC 1A17872]|uniref:glycogen debranching protein GlgX n=1 Tax=Celerinatantimonas sp. MCCC 1A17872 TaxID=3177514 RepID=UPI0038BEF71D